MNSLVKRNFEETLPFLSSELEGISSFIEQLPDIVRYEVAAQTDFVQIELEFEKNFSNILFLVGSSSVVIIPIQDEPALLTTYIYPRFGLRLGDVAVSLQWSTDLFREAVKTSEGQFISAEEARIAPVPFCINFGVLLIEIDNNGRLTLDLPNAFAINVEITVPFEIANTGFILEVGEASLSLGGNEEGNGDSPSFSDFSLNVPSAKVHLPEPLRFFAEQGIGISDAELSEDGFTGVISIPPDEAARFLLGFSFVLHSFEVEFRQNAIIRSEITGTITVPYIDASVDVEVSIDLDGNISIFAKADIDIHNCSPLPIQINRVGLAVENDSAAFEIDATLEINDLGGLTLDPIDFQFSVDSQGNVHIDGGWIELPEQLQADLYGFQLELSRIALGQQSEGIRSIALDGALRLAEGIQAGASVKGLRLTWQADDFLGISMDGIGIEYRVPNVIGFKGEVCLIDETFAGGICVNLPAVGLEADGYVSFGIEDGISFMAVQLALSLPAGTPLFSTGLAIYGMEGLFAHNQFPNVDTGKWHEWYQNAPDPRSTKISKWTPRAGGFAFGAGLNIGTLADNGYAFSGNLLLTLVLPGPVILLEGWAGILQERASINQDPPLGCVAVLDGNDSSLLLGLNAHYKYPGSGSNWEGMLIDISGDTEAFFSLSDPTAWHLFIGQNDPRERRINADIFNGLFEANAYFMLQQGSLEMGASLDFGDTWKFGPLKATIEAYLEAGAFVSLKPAQFVGEIGLEGSLGLSVFGYGLSIYLDTNLSAQIFTPYIISGSVTGGISLPWPLPDFSATVSLTWEENTPDSPPIPLPLQEVSIEHRQTTLTWPLTRKAPLNELDPPVTILPNHEDNSNPGYRVSSPSSTIEAEFDTLPVVPLDGLPKLTFSRSVHDEAEIGNPYAVPDPQIEKIGDPKGTGGPEVKYDLLSIMLQKRENDDWATVAQKGEVTSEVIQELFGTWAPTPDIERGRHDRSEVASLSNTKLWLWSLNPFEALGRGSGNFVQGFMGDEFSYPCSPPFIPTPDPTKPQQREDEIIEEKLRLRNESLSSQLSKFTDSSPLLDPYSIYRLKIITQTTIEHATTELQPTVEEYAYFKTEGPPGYSELTFSLLPDETPPDTLETLHPYICQTLPITVPELGEKPIRPRPVYRAYDHAVFYNNNSSHVEQMYRQADLDLRLLIMDENGQTGHLDNGQAASLALEPSERVSQQVTELNRLWLEILNSNTCGLETPASLSFETVGRAQGRLLHLLPDMPYLAMLVPLLLRDDFSRPRNWWSGSMAGWNHQYHSDYQGRNARIEPSAGGNRVRLLDIVVPGLIDDLSTIEFKSDTARASKRYKILSSDADHGTLLVLDGEPLFAGGSSEWTISAQGVLASASANRLRLHYIHDPRRRNEKPSYEWSMYSVAVVFGVDNPLATFDFSVLLGISGEFSDGLRVECSRSGTLRRGTSSPRRNRIRIFDDREGRSDTAIAEKLISLRSGTFQLTAECIDRQVRVFFNNEFVVETQTQNSIIGSAGLETNQAGRIRFHQFEVDDLSGTRRSVYDYRFTTSKYTNFSHLVSSYQDRIWIRQAESISSALPYEEMAKQFLGESRLQAVDVVELTHVETPNQAAGDPTWLHIASPEPLDWERVDMTLERLLAVSLFEPALAEIKLSSLNLSEAINANNELILSVRSKIDLAGYSVDFRLLNSDMDQGAKNKGILLKEENFDTEDLTTWKIVDEAPYSKFESNWQVRNGILEQTSNLYGFVGGEHSDPGTYAIWQDSEWSDCRLRLRLRSNDNDAIGFIFRYVDQNNYYRFSMDHERKYRRLIKKVFGDTTVLWESSEGFSVGIWYGCQMDGTGSRLRLWIDGDLIFDLTDQSHSSGGIGLYCRANKCAQFGSIRVEAQPWTWTPLHTFANDSIFPDGKRIILGSENREFNDTGDWDQPSYITYNSYDSLPPQIRTRGIELRIRSNTGKILHQRGFTSHEGTPVEIGNILRKADDTAFFLSMETPSKGSLYRLTLTYQRQIGEFQSETWQSQAGNGNPEVGQIEFLLKGDF